MLGGTKFTGSASLYKIYQNFELTFQKIKKNLII